jgi:hypothetical protein
MIVDEHRHESYLNISNLTMLIALIRYSDDDRLLHAEYELLSIHLELTMYTNFIKILKKSSED